MAYKLLATVLPLEQSTAVNSLQPVLLADMNLSRMPSTVNVSPITAIR